MSGFTIDRRTALALSLRGAPVPHETAIDAIVQPFLSAPQL